MFDQDSLDILYDELKELSMICGWLVANVAKKTDLGFPDASLGENT